MKKPVIVFFIFLVVLALPFIINAASGHMASADVKPDLSKGTDSDATVCVDPKGGTREETKDNMRVNHQQLLKDERVKVVREGVKDNRLQIERCFSCHTYKDFCQECHKYNGVQPGCMDKTNGCHSTEKQPESFRPEGY
mgnify:CR=1 FL=1